MTRTFRALLTLAVFTSQLCASAIAQSADKSTAEAQDIYKAKCQMCHAADGSGNTPAGKKFGAKDLKSPEVQKHTDAELFAVIAKGQNKMPAFTGKLNDQQMLTIVAYIRHIAGK